jgi:hypothetical protein
MVRGCARWRGILSEWRRERAPLRRIRTAWVNDAYVSCYAISKDGGLYVELSEHAHTYCLADVQVSYGRWSAKTTPPLPQDVFK